jgi:hypothetical protein
MPLNVGTRRILNVLIVERRDTLYINAAIERETKGLYLKDLGKPT